MLRIIARLVLTFVFLVVLWIALVLSVLGMVMKFAAFLCVIGIVAIWYGPLKRVLFRSAEVVPSADVYAEQKTEPEILMGHLVPKQDGDLPEGEPSDQDFRDWLVQNHYTAKDLPPDKMFALRQKFEITAKQRAH